MVAHTEQTGGNRRSASGLDTAVTRSGLLLTVLCLIYIATALCMQPDRYLSLSTNYAGILLGKLPVLLVTGLGLAGLALGRPRPTRFIIDTLKERGLAAALVILLFIFGIAAFTTFRIMIPELVPFYADPILADLDLWLHGADPWAWAHGIVQEPISMLIFNGYGYWWFAQWFGIVLFVAFWNGTAGRMRYLWAFALTTLLCGTVLPIMLSSCGPIFYDRFYDGDRFAGLGAALAADQHAASVQVFAKYLLDTYQSGGPELGGGITAMPSMHVAVITLNAFFLTGFGRGWAVVGWSFAALILFGSVYTGWHYAVDGYVSIIVVSVLWHVTGRIFSRDANRQAVDMGLSVPGPAA